MQRFVRAYLSGASHGVAQLAVVVLLASCGDAGGPHGSTGPIGTIQSALTNAQCDLNMTFLDWGKQATPPRAGLGTAAAVTAFDNVMKQMVSDHPEFLKEPFDGVYNWPGITVAATKAGKLVFTRAYGFSDRSQLQPANVDDLFRIASVTKPITASTILRLIELGAGTPNPITLDSKPFQILAADIGTPHDPNLNDVTVRQLLTHTAGWEYDGNAANDYDPMFDTWNIWQAQGLSGPPGCIDVAKYVVANKSLKWKPSDNVFSYFNFNYCVLGLLIQKHSGYSTYTGAVNDLVLGPAGVVNMALGNTLESQRLDREVVYDTPGDDVCPSVFDLSGNAQVPCQYGNFYLDAMWGHGGWVASAVDLMRFVGVVDQRPAGGNIFTQQSTYTQRGKNLKTLDCELAAGCTAKSQLTAYATGDTWYGEGFFFYPDSSYDHDGRLPGTGTYLSRNFDDTNFVMLTNTSPELGRNDYYNYLEEAYQAAVTAGGIPDHDLFDQFGTFESWMTGSEYQNEFNLWAAASHYPVRVEGKNVSGTYEYRGQFVPLHPNWNFSSVAGWSCNDYQTHVTQLGPSFQLTSLQWFVGNDGTKRYNATWVQPDWSSYP